MRADREKVRLRTIAFGISPSPGTLGEGRGEGSSVRQEHLIVEKGPSPYPSPRVPGEGTKNATRWVRLVFIVGVLTGLVYLHSNWFHPPTAFSEEEIVGAHLARGDGFVSPFMDSAGAPPSAWCPPVYPMVVGAIYRLLGLRTPMATMAILTFGVFCRAVAAAGVYGLGRQLFSQSAGLLAASLFLLNPIFIHSIGYGWDNLLGLAMFLWLLMAAFSEGVSPIVLGAGAGLLLLTNAAYGLAIPVLLFIAARRWVGYRILIFAATLLLTLLPWTIRNYAQFDRLLFVRGNLWTELWLGNQPAGTGWMTLDSLASHPSVDRVNHDEVIALGESQYAQICRQRFMAEWRADPMGFVERSANRAAYLVVGEPGRQGAALRCILAAFGLSGAWAFVRAKHPARWVALAAVMAVAPYAVTQVHDRYLLPVQAVLALCAAGVCDFLLLILLPKAIAYGHFRSGPLSRYSGRGIG